MINFDIKNRWSGDVQFTAEIECAESEALSVKLGLAVKRAVKRRANLRAANLAGANLADANLADANLRGANLADADLRDANLADANLADANLRGADLADADLRGADLRGANLADANLRGANLADANLAGADLRGANLAAADLRAAYLAAANLAGANLAGADLRAAKGAELAIAKTRILPEGQIIGWKKCCNGVLVKLRIPAKAKRSHAFGRKCRAEFADVLQVVGAEEGVSQHDGKTVYRKGERVTCDKWSDDWQQECAGGIHFYITREEAEAH